nr:restriction endonuclease subunit S [uncultured Aggregatibacter sp.]
MKNNRTFLEKLLDGAEVEWQTVKSLCNDNFWLMPATPEFDDNGNIPYITSKNIKGGKIDFQNTKYINENVYQELSRTRCIVENDILISMIGTIGEAVIVKKEDLCFYGQNMYILRLNNKLVNHKFFLYYFTAPFILNSLLSKKNASNQGYLKAGQIENLKIPIPPLSVQTEIVKILDALTALTSELTSELILRRKQYEYYREKLLSFDSLEQLNMGGAKKKLIDVAIYAKVRISADKLNKENYVGVENLLQNKLGKTSSNYVPTEGSFIEYLPNDILIGNIRPYLRKIWLADKTGGTNGDVLVIRLTDENIIPRYLYHILANEHFFEYNVKYSKGAKMPRGDKTAILQYEFDVPPLEEQHRIVSILDKFETFTNSITEGLPLAIEQSQKRYEYYRELLLSFK